MTGGGQPCGEMDVLEKLTILTDAAKYDAACTSSGGNRRAKAGYIGNTTSSIAGCCHSFSADGRCVTLLKVLMTNRCVYDCKYCVNRRSNEAKRAMFTPEELLDASHPDFNPQVDPKCSWALRHLDFFPVEVNRADYEALLRIPGVGVVSAKRILVSRRARKLRIEDLPKLGVVMKRAQYFLTASGRMADGLRFTPDSLLRNLIAAERPSLPQPELEQMSLFAPV